MNCTYLQANRTNVQKSFEDLEIQENERNQEGNMDFFQIFRVAGFAVACKCSSNLLY